jgi:acetylglutamate kinase
MKVPEGFTFSGVHAGIKPNRRDLALIFSDAPCAAAGCFTANKAKAAPVLDAERRLPSAEARAIVINSGNANALTGPAGLEDVRTILDHTAKALEVSPGAVLSASTGVIGRRVPVTKITAALPKLVQSLRPELEACAEAIMTTDTRIKTAARSLTIGGREVTLSGICKGSGMIAPELATMIAVVVTDCAIHPTLLASALRQSMVTSFNSISVDDDMSTNDVVFAMANGRAKNPPLADPGPDFDRFSSALGELCCELAREIAADGEGATKLLEVHISGAPSDEIARDLAKAVVGSNLVKAAMFGADPNWGRILAAAGARAGSRGYPVDPFHARVQLQGVPVFERAPLVEDLSSLRSKMRAPEIHAEIDFRAGPGRATAWGCDLSYDYVKINADYSSLIIPTPEGGVAKDDRLSNYSPAFKASLLVEALSYISKFSGKRCVVKYGGAAMVKDSLKKSFCEDIILLWSVGLRPIIVHGGGPEITATLEKLGGKAEFVDGIRVTNASDVKVVEMVLTGGVNTELVTLLNQEGGHAVGISGKDGALLRARKVTAEGGRDLGQVGEVTRVNREFLEMLVNQGYVPVISPVGLGEDGLSYNINADAVAAEVAAAIGATKLIYLTDVPGILRHGELVTDLSAQQLAKELEGSEISGGMKPKVKSILKALGAGVERVHIIDGRVPHTVIGELFTDRGVGTLITA